MLSVLRIYVSAPGCHTGTCSHGPDGDYQCTCHDKIAFRDFYTGFKGRKLHMCQARCSEEYQRNCEGPFKKWGTCDQMDNENDVSRVDLSRPVFAMSPFCVFSGVHLYLCRGEIQRQDCKRDERQEEIRLPR